MRAAHFITTIGEYQNNSQEKFLFVAVSISEVFEFLFAYGKK